MHTNIDNLFDALWQDYLSITPSASRIHKLLQSQSANANIINDHVAFRTFNLDKVRLHKLAAHFESLGYSAHGDYNFAAKKLTAKHYQHPDLSKPKVFISELRVEELSNQAQQIIHSMVEKVADDASSQTDFLYSGTHWQITKNQYDSLLAESEYAAWMAAWGFRANHFTVSVNHLTTIEDLAATNQILKNAGFVLNASGGEIKGGKEVYLAQSSTMADKMPVRFSDIEFAIPSCFYEFAERFELPSGELYQGFVAASADKIFESTNTK